MTFEEKITSSVTFSDLEKKVLIQAYKRYRHPKGFLTHHGDCRIYSTDHPHCSCGLIHDLLVLEEPSFAFKNFYKDLDISEGCPEQIEHEIELSEIGRIKKEELDKYLI